MPSSNGSKKSELYEHLFRSIKAGLGIDVEEDDAIQAFREGKYPELNNLMGIAVMYFHGRQRGEPSTSFFQEYPPALREYLQKLCEEAFCRAIQHNEAREFTENE
jgi:hypothetical protein